MWVRSVLGTVLLRAMSLQSWTYTGSNAERASAEGGRQRAQSGDPVYDDELGQGVLDTQGAPWPGAAKV